MKKYLIVPNLKGAYVTSTGVPVDIAASDHGKDYADEAAFAAAFNLTTKDAYAAKQTALAKLQKDFEADLAKGYVDKELGITIAIGDSDRQQFNDLEQHLIRKAVPDNQAVTIKALDGSLHQITRVQFHELLIRAGDYYLSLWGTLQQKKAAL
ncbi:MAG: hypothetical protein ACFUZC_07660 [Chthoniobacteraceae bacterium]